MPAGLDVTRSPLRPVAVTVRVTDVPGGLAVSGALRVAPPKEPLIVTELEAVTDAVVTVNDALVAPAATVMLGGTVATVVLPLDSVTTAPPEGATLVRVTVPWDVLPPTTATGLSASADSTGACAAAWGVKLRTVDHGPAVPAELIPRTRHQ